MSSWGSRSWCAGSLTRWVTVLVLIQCCLVLVYITFIQTSSSSSHNSQPQRHPAHFSSTRDLWRQAETPSGEGGGINTRGISNDLAPMHRVKPKGASSSQEIILADPATDYLVEENANDTKPSHVVAPSNQRPIFLERSLSDPKKRLPDKASILEINDRIHHRNSRQGKTVMDDGVQPHSKGDGGVPFNLNSAGTLAETAGNRPHHGKIPKGASEHRLLPSHQQTMAADQRGHERVPQSLNLFADFTDIANHPAFPELVRISDDKSAHVLVHRNGTCLIEGTLHLFNSTRKNATKCVCRRGWHGSHCSVPDSVIFSEASQYANSVHIRKTPRRVINAIAFNVEFELLEARLHELGDTVDLYILHESNYTNYGTAKPLRLLQRLRKGYLREYHHKFLYLFRGDFPIQGRANGWVVDESQRTFISTQGLKHLRNVRDDDLFIYNDADEIPSRDALLFLKLHDGYPEPIGFSFRWSVFGFYWKQPEPSRVMAACSVKTLQTVFEGDIFKVRSHNFDTVDTNATQIEAFVDSGGIFHDWFMGEDGGFAGWHCSWCLPPEGVRTKLKSAINADFPRWGDFPEKLNISYIRNLIVTGMWFDDQTTFSMVTPRTDPNYAPRYTFQAYNKFRFLLDSNYYSHDKEV